MSHIFISYSRKDIIIAGKIVQALAKDNLDTWIDWKSIPKGEEWEQEIYQGIEAAEAFLFLISPDSILSEMCKKEIGHAAENGKRILPIYIRKTDDGNIPEVIRKHNWIYCREGQDDFDQAIGEIRETIRTDYEWLKFHTELQVKALKWQRRDGEKSLLLRGRELEEAERMLGLKAGLEPHPVDLQREYLLRSRQAVNRQRRQVIIGLGFGLIAMSILAVFAWIQRNTAISETNAKATALVNEENARGTAQAEKERAEEQARIALARQLAAQSDVQLEQDPSLALLLAVEAYNTAETYESRNALLSGLTFSPYLYRAFHGHENVISSIAVSPDGKLIATGSCKDFSLGFGISLCFQGEIRIWDFGTGKLVTVLDAHNASEFSYIHSLAFSPDGSLLASGAGDRTVILWDARNWKQIGEPLTGHGQDVFMVAFNPSGSRLYSASWDGKIVEWDTEHVQATGRAIDTQNQMIAMAISQDGNWIATGDVAGIVKLWDTKNFKLLRTPITAHSESITSLAFSPDHTWLASVSSDGEIKFWDMTNDGRQANSLSLPQDHTGEVNFMIFNPDGNSLAVGLDDKSIILYRQPLTDTPIIEIFTGHTDTINALAFSPDGRFLFSGAGQIGLFSKDNRLWAWDLMRDQGISRYLSGSQSGVSRILFSPNGKWMLTGNQDGSVLLYDADSAAFVERLEALDGYSRSLAFSPDSKLIAASDNSGNILLWDFTNQQTIGLPFGKGSEATNVSPTNASTHELLFSPDGQTLFSTEAGPNDQIEVHSWNVSNQEPAGKTITVPFGYLSGIAISPDGQALAIAGYDEAMIWNLETMASDLALDNLGVVAGGPTSTTFSPDLSLIAVAGSFDRKVPITSMKFVIPIERFTLDVGQLTFKAAFSPDMKMLATGGIAVRGEPVDLVLWDLKTHAVMGRPLSGFHEIVSAIAFRPDGKALAVGDSQGTLLFLELDPKLWISYACNIVGRNLTKNEWQQFLSDKDYQATCPQWPNE